MPSLDANGTTIEYQVEGSGPPLLLVMGLGGQLTDWHPGFIEALTPHFTVIRFDNRDSGRSPHWPGPAPTRWELVKGNVWRGWGNPPYRLADMAADAAALLDGLAISHAHVVGMSMGGMIAQELAIGYPPKVSSLTSIMSNTGDRRNGRPTLRVVAELARRKEPNQAQALALTLDMMKIVGGRDWDEQEQTRRTSASLQRAFNPAGVLRQTLAISASPNRTEGLRQLALPTLVIHGLDDVLVMPSGGIATARAVPNARLILYPRMGHDLPATRHHEMAAAILANTNR